MFLSLSKKLSDLIRDTLLLLKGTRFSINITSDAHWQTFLLIPKHTGTEVWNKLDISF